MSVFPPGLDPLEDVGAATWVEEALRDWPLVDALVHSVTLEYLQVEPDSIAGL